MTYRWRRSGLVALWRCRHWLVTVLLWVPVAVYLLYGLGLRPRVIVFVTGITAVLLLSLAWRLVDVLNERFYLDGRRGIVGSIDVLLFLRRRGRWIPLRAVQQATYHFNNPIALRLRIGNVEIRSAAHARPIVWDGVRHPDRIARIVNRFAK